MIALAGPAFHPNLGLRVFCGEAPPDDGPESEESAKEEFPHDDHS
jgi:hypothetical protein